jgi:uncharacterized protein YbjT (DUF2867 family)
MRILLTGASGFIGRHLATALEANGHAVVCATRQLAQRARPACTASCEADFTRDHDAASWVPKLQGIDVVINAVGIIRESGAQTFESLHVKAPCALFDACVLAGVQRVINISALGANENARSRYHISKRRADQHLASLPLAWTIVQPSLVYGMGGQSARLLSGLASLPWIPVPGGGTQQVQPIYIDDLTAAMVALVNSTAADRQVLPFVGPSAISLRDFLARLRLSMHLGRAHFASIPLGLVRVASHLAALAPGSLLDAETLDMLLRGNVGDPHAVNVLLGREARPPDQFIGAEEATTSRIIAQLSWLLPLLRSSIAIVWIVTGMVSLGLFPTAASYQLLWRVGVPAGVAPLFLYGAAALDIMLGLATVLMRRRQNLWRVQIALIVFYTVLISMRMPEFWLHPYGPLLKNLPLLAAIALLYFLEKR